MLPAGVGYLAGLVLAAVLVIAAAGKIARPAATAAAFAALGVPAAAAAARLVPTAELLVAVLLVAMPRAGGVAALVLLAAFTAALVRVLRSGIRTPCRCFGGVRDVPVSAADVLRNAMLAGLAVAAIAGGGVRLPSGGALVLVAAVVGVGLAALRFARDHR